MVFNFKEYSLHQNERERYDRPNHSVVRIIVVQLGNNLMKSSALPISRCQVGFDQLVAVFDCC